MEKQYRVREFADLAGVTVRALHHYERLGLLRPKRSAARYRLYAIADLERLEQVVALKFLGIPLKQIKSVLDRGPRALPRALEAQRRALEEKRRRLDGAIRAIAEAERSLTDGRTADAGLLTKIIEVIEMQNHEMKKYYTDSAWAKLSERREAWTPDEEKRKDADVRAWAELFADVEASLAEDPAGPKAQAIVDRWRALVERFTGGDAEISDGVRRAWADRANWTGEAKERSAAFSNPKVWQFIEKAAAARHR